MADCGWISRRGFHVTGAELAGFLGLLALLHTGIASSRHCKFGPHLYLDSGSAAGKRAGNAVDIEAGHGVSTAVRDIDGSRRFPPQTHAHRSVAVERSVQQTAGCSSSAPAAGHVAGRRFGTAAGQRCNLRAPLQPLPC
eukprot:361451-Chlamydomonas_euryale.AAC.9